MAERITVMLDTKLVKKLRILQATEIAKSNKSISFSKVLNTVITRGLKK